MTTLVIRCPEHLSYTGLSRPDRDCFGCAAVHMMRGATVKPPEILRPITIRWGAK